MVQINLLPKKEAKKGKFKIDFHMNLRPIIFIFTGVMLVIIIVWAVQGMKFAAKQRTLTQLNRELDSLKVTLEKLSTLKAEKEGLSLKLEFMQQHLKRQLLWAENLNRLSKLLPEGIWLTAVVLHTRRKDHLAKYEKLDIRGSAISVGGKEPIDLIGGFMSAIKNDSILAGQFAQVQLISSQRGQKANIETMEFQLSCEFH
jgi:Tfp pilus assembly protein PilN